MTETTADISPEFFFVAPISAMLVTDDNMEAVAKWCGGSVERPAKAKKDCVVVKTPKSASLSWAFPGMYVTRRIVVSTEGVVHETWGVFRASYFARNYFETPIESIDAIWAIAATKVKR